MEKKIFDRQVAKISVSQRVVDTENTERHYTEADLRELFKPYVVPPVVPIQHPEGPVDPVLDFVLAAYHSVLSVSPLLHESLLGCTALNLSEKEKEEAIRRCVCPIFLFVQSLCLGVSLTSISLLFGVPLRPIDLASSPCDVNRRTRVGAHSLILWCLVWIQVRGGQARSQETERLLLVNEPHRQPACGASARTQPPSTWVAPDGAAPRARGWGPPDIRPSHWVAPPSVHRGGWPGAGTSVGGWSGTDCPRASAAARTRLGHPVVCPHAHDPLDVLLRPLGDRDPPDCTRIVRVQGRSAVAARGHRCEQPACSGNGQRWGDCDWWRRDERRRGDGYAPAGGVCRGWPNGGVKVPPLWSHGDARPTRASIPGTRPRASKTRVPRARSRVPAEPRATHPSGARP